MVKRIDKSKSEFSKYVGSMQISANNLIQLLGDEKIFTSTEFTATNNEFQFESLKDMQSNLELLKGKPEIRGEFATGGFFRIDFAKDVNIHSYSLKTESELSSLTKLYKRLCEFRSPFYPLKYYPQQLIFPVFVVLMFYVFVAAYVIIYHWLTGSIPDSSNSSTHIEIFLSTIIFTLSIVAAPIVLLKFFVGLFPIVILKETSKLWDKVKENAVSYIVVFLLGVALTTISTWVSSAN